MFRTALLLPILLIGCTNVVSHIQYHKQPSPITCYSSATQKDLMVQAVGKNAAILRIGDKTGKKTSTTKYDEIALSKSEVKEIMDLIGVYENWRETIKQAGVDITETKFVKTAGDGVLSIDFSSRKNASVISLSVKINREDSSYVYTTSNTSCLYNSCSAAMDHLIKMDELSKQLP